MRMKFGRYKGVAIEDLPDEYLVWLLTIDLYDDLRFLVEEERRRRDNQARQWRPEARKMAEELITAGYRGLSKKYHPDTGGSTKAMQTLNEVIERLKRLV